MKINRALGFILFVMLARFVLSDAFHAASGAFVATMGLVEVASQTAQAMLTQQ